jgi:lysophospholipase L1-like esterase
MAGVLYSGVLLSLAFAGCTLGASTNDAPTPPALHYTVLGDSIMITGSPTSADLYKRYLEDDVHVSVVTTNLAVYGWTSGTLSDHLETDQAMIDSVRRADLVTVTIGTNDYGLGRYDYSQVSECRGTAGPSCLRNMERYLSEKFTKIISRIRSANPNAIILASDIYNPFVAEDVANGDQAIYLPFINELNSSIHSIAASNDIPVANLYRAFNGPDGLEDPIAKGYTISATDGHPTQLGNRVIADQFRELNSAVLQKLRPTQEH